MKLNLRWMLGAVAAGCALQYLWLESIPASERHAVGVVLTTVACNLFAALRMVRPRSTAGWWDYLLTCAFIGTIAASASYWALELLGVPEAAINSLSKSPMTALLMTALLTGGWLVGLLSGLSNLFSEKCVRPQE